MSCLCQICGRRFYDDDDTSNPLAHFCIGLDGPAIIHEDVVESAPHTPELKATTTTHAQEDLDEIARLRKENEKLRRRLSSEKHVEFAAQ
ncbi:hypothetical protein HII31_03875 [Pseudocercospora fuligena]|uniref:Uncharacterized protein n=1 Tax=Pseudocercospora fuligena TaxID=685502 RepID=A0A8H6RQ38_9PEZI|nr:hypothetical protein HII31_03875 [Pseudocercospora fuligena]